jgi:hypothetical protein
VSNGIAERAFQVASYSIGKNPPVAMTVAGGLALGVWRVVLFFLPLPPTLSSSLLFFHDLPRLYLTLRVFSKFAIGLKEKIGSFCVGGSKARKR